MKNIYRGVAVADFLIEIEPEARLPDSIDRNAHFH